MKTEASTKQINEVRPGDQTPSGIVYLSEPAEQPAGSVSILVRYPSGRRELLDFDNPASDSEVMRAPCSRCNLRAAEPGDDLCASCLRAIGIDVEANRAGVKNTLDQEIAHREEWMVDREEWMVDTRSTPHPQRSQVDIIKQVHPKDLKRGDQFTDGNIAVWTAVQDAELDPDAPQYRCLVRYVEYADIDDPDFTELRTWDEHLARTQTLPVVRRPDIKARMLADYEQARAAFNEIADAVADPAKVDRTRKALDELKAAIDTID